MDRREFIKKSALGRAVITSPFSIRSFGINRKLKVGLIGAGWYGMVISKAALLTRKYREGWQHPMRT